MVRESFATGSTADDTSDEDLVVQDDELLVNEAESEFRSESRRPNGARRMSRRVPRSGVRPGWARAGDVLAGKYLVESVRGKSGPEVIVFARHLELDQRVRLRYLVPEASASPEAVARFQRGARKAREMRSEHAERVIDFGRLDSGSPYRVTEMPGGPSLEEMLRVRGALAIDEAVNILTAVCEPVAEAHAAGIVHRNLCTSNIFVERRADGSQIVKVLDFGVADPLEPNAFRENAAGGAPSLEGPLGFASPEQIRNSGSVDARADVWALGAVLYELLTGVRVFEAETSLTLLAMIAADQPAPINWLRPEIPEALERVVLSCLEKDPEARPRSVVDLAVALAPYGSGDSHGAASRVARVAMRTTRPPPLPSTAPHSIPASARASHAIVRTSIPVAPVVEKTGALPAWATMTGGALVGVSAALATALLLRLQLPPPAPPAPVAVAPLAVPAPAPPTLASPAVEPTTSNPAATNPAAASPPKAAPAAAPAPRPAKRAESTATPEAASKEPPTAVAQKAAPPQKRASSETEVAGRTTATPKSLFGGVD